MAFRGWNDGAEAATGALRYLRRRVPVDACAKLDPDEFFVFSEHRPKVRNRDGVREIRWPRLDFVPLRVSGATNDLILGLGTEPDLKWKTFATHLVELAQVMQVREVMTVGALIADTTHTLPVPISGGATDPARAEELGLQSSGSGYEGPTGIVGVLGDAFRRAEIPYVSLWAGVPYYVQGGPDPRATKALLQRINTVFKLGARAPRPGRPRAPLPNAGLGGSGGESRDPRVRGTLGAYSAPFAGWRLPFGQRRGAGGGRPSAARRSAIGMPTDPLRRSGGVS